jgi:hypothetical protein
VHPIGLQPPLYQLKQIKKEDKVINIYECRLILRGFLEMGFMSQ